MADKKNSRRAKRMKVNTDDTSTSQDRNESKPENLVRRLQEERNAYYRQCDETQKLKDKFFENTLTNDPNESDANEESELLVVADVHPGKTVFIKQKKCQIFDMKTLISTSLNYELSLGAIRECLELKYVTFPNINSNVCQALFRLMTIDNNYAVCESCFVILRENYHIWMPKLNDVVEVLFNWGATWDTLNFTNCEKLIIFRCEEPKLTDKMINKKNFKYFNFSFFFEYLVVILRRKCYSLTEIFPLVKILITVGLENSSWIPQIQTIIHTAVDSLDNWNNSKVNTFARYIYDHSEDINNLIAVAILILPNTPKCQHISLCLAFAILRFLIKDEICFNFPNQDVELLQLVESMAFKIGTKDDLYTFYLLIQLLNYIVCKGRFEYHNTDMLKSLPKMLDDFKDCISRNHNSIDAELVKGRINYCIAMWGLFEVEKNNEDEYVLLKR